MIKNYPVNFAKIVESRKYDFFLLNSYSVSGRINFKKYSLLIKDFLKLAAAAEWSSLYFLFPLIYLTLIPFPAVI